MSVALPPSREHDDEEMATGWLKFINQRRRCRLNTLSMNRNAERKRRLQDVLDIVRNEVVSNHEMLLEKLRERGTVITQSTLSRDLAQLGMVKTLTEYGVYRYAIPERIKMTKLSGMFSQSVTSVNPAMNTVVIKTYGGMASAVCSSLDLREIPLIVGTIAGDDTIFAITRSEKDAEELTLKLRKLI